MTNAKISSEASAVDAEKPTNNQDNALKSETKNYKDPPSLKESSSIKPTNKKRKRVSRACVYCQRSHMSCDEGRPCKRCLSRRMGEMCHDGRCRRRGRKRKNELLSDNDSDKERDHLTRPLSPSPLRNERSPGSGASASDVAGTEVERFIPLSPPTPNASDSVPTMTPTATATVSSSVTSESLASIVGATSSSVSASNMNASSSTTVQDSAQWTMSSPALSPSSSSSSLSSPVPSPSSLFATVPETQAVFFVTPSISTAVPLTSYPLNALGGDNTFASLSFQPPPVVISPLPTYPVFYMAPHQLPSQVTNLDTRIVGGVSPSDVIPSEFDSFDDPRYLI
jgi:hypothetical protein